MSNNIFGFVPKSAFLSIKSQLAGGDGYVTINTAQTITGQKTFDTNTIFNYDIYVESIHSSFQVETTYVSSTDIYASNSYLFGDGTTQTTAYKSLVPGNYTTANIVVDSNGAISSIVTGTTSTTASQITMTDVSDATSYALCFATQSPNGAKAVYQDYNQLTYVPSTTTLSTSNVDVSSTLTTVNSNVTGTLDAYLFNCNFVLGDLISNSSTSNFQISAGPGQTLDLYCNNGGTHNWLLAGSYNRSYVQIQSYAASLNAEPLTLYGYDTYQQIIFNPQAGNGSWNPIVGSGYASIVARGTAVDNKSLAITLWSNTTLGLLLTPTTIQMRFGNSNITANNTSITLNATSPVSVTGYTIPSNDNSAALATTAWVQSFIGTGSGPAASVQMTENVTNNDFPICYSTGSPNGFKSVYQDYSDLIFNPSSGILTVSKINKVRFWGDTATFTIYCGYNRSTYPGYCAVFGMYAGENLYGSYNTFIGYRAGQGSGATFSASQNTCVGDLAGKSLDTGTNNVYIGHLSGENNQNGNNNTFIGANTGTALNLAVSNCILIGQNVQAPSTVANNSILIGDSNQTQYIRGQINYRTQLIAFVSGGPTSFNLYTTVPQVVFLSSDINTGVFTVVLPAPTSDYYGAKIIFRKVPLLSDVTITVDGGLVNKILNYNTVGTMTSFGFNTNYVYVDMVCTGTYWCVNNLV